MGYVPAPPPLRKLPPAAPQGSDIGTPSHGEIWPGWPHLMRDCCTAVMWIGVIVLIAGGPDSSTAWRVFGAALMVPELAIGLWELVLTLIQSKGRG